MKLSCRNPSRESRSSSIPASRRFPWFRGRRRGPGSVDLFSAWGRMMPRLLAVVSVLLALAGPAKGDASAQEPPIPDPELPELRRSYVVLVDGAQQGTLDQTLRHHPHGYEWNPPEGGALRLSEPVWVSSSRMSAPLQEHERTVVFSSPELRPVLLEQRPLRGGEPVALLHAENGRIVGPVDLPGGGGPREMDLELPDGAILPGMDDYLLAAADLFPGQRLNVPMLDLEEGGITTVTFQVAEETETVESPAGSFQVLRVSVAGGPAPQTLLVRERPPHVVVRQEFRGRPLALELTHLDERVP